MGVGVIVSDMGKNVVFSADHDAKGKARGRRSPGVGLRLRSIVDISGGIAWEGVCAFFYHYRDKNRIDRYLVFLEGMHCFCIIN